jgi:hypothetical protein
MTEANGDEKEKKTGRRNTKFRKLLREKLRKNGRKNKGEKEDCLKKRKLQGACDNAWRVRNFCVILVGNIKGPL